MKRPAGKGKVAACEMHIAVSRMQPPKRTFKLFGLTMHKAVLTNAPAPTKHHKCVCVRMLVRASVRASVR
eukprot:9002455-Pyramimonas_sp.AAC.1